MISPTKQAEHVIQDGLSGERREFRIKATGKAFRTLIDGLYENKIGALVRELISNGYDSHAAAGIPDVPLSVTAPTGMDPVFKVRDYGTSMTHETIMDLYSTIFESSKESTNDQVGMFGLGSKSPFAYTDTFSVTAYLDGVKRVYVAHVSDDDIPQITHVGTEEADEPNGIEVQVPATVHDVHTFAHEIQKNIMAATTPPIVDGLTTAVPEPLASGDGWKIYRDAHGYGRIGIRQGCVIYPLHSSYYVSAVSHGYTVIMDVPIGSVDVTASRESLSLTPETREVVSALVQEVDKKVRQFAREIKFENRLDEFNKHHHYGFLTVSVGRNRVVLTPDKPNRKLPGQSFQYYKSARKVGVLTSVDTPSQWRFLVERDGEKVLRKQIRIAAYYRTLGQRGRLALINARDLPRIQRLFGLEAHQIVSVASLPDVAPAPRITTGGGYTTGTAAPKVKTLPAGTYWVPKVGVKAVNVNIGSLHVSDAERLKYVMIWPLLGFTADLSEVVYLTDKQAAAMGATNDTLFTREVERRVAQYAADNNFEEKFETQAAVEQFNTYVSNKLSPYNIIPNQMYGKLNHHLSALVIEAIVAEFTPTRGDEFTSNDLLICRLISAQPTKISLPTAQMDARVKELLAPFEPILKDHDPIMGLVKFYSENN